MDTNLTNFSLNNPVFNGSVKTLLLLFLLCPPGVPCTFIPFGLSGPAGDTVLHRDTKPRKTHSVHPDSFIVSLTQQWYPDRPKPDSRSLEVPGKAAPDTRDPSG